MSRFFIFTLAFGLAFDAALAFVLSRFSDDTYTTFWAFFLFLVIAPLLLGGWTFLKGWAGYFLFTKKIQTTGFLKELRSHHFPNPLGETDAVAYFWDVANRDSLPQSLRARAMSNWAELEATKRKDGFGAGAMALLSASSALEEYDRRFSPSEPSADSEV